MSVTTEVIDLLVVLDYVQDRPFVNKNAVFLMGCSQGSSLHLLPKRKDEIKRNTLLASVPAPDARKSSLC